MWQDHSFSQRSKVSKIVMEVKIGGNENEELDKTLKSWGSQYRGSS